MLTYVQTEQHYSLYLDHDGNEIYLAHGPGMRRLVEFDDIDLIRSWYDWQLGGRYGAYEWVESIRASITDPDLADEILWCDNCSRPGHQDGGINVANGWACDNCEHDYIRCYRCEELVRSTTTTLGDDEVCQSCCEEYYSWCDDCDGYYPSDNSEEHEHNGCNCDSPQLDFTVRNDGLPALANDERVTVNLPAGEISQEGLHAIATCLYRVADRAEDRAERLQLWSISNVDALIEHVGATWQTNRGNFTKRLSRYCYNELKVKLVAATISEIGNIASTHCQGADFAIEVTRDLNLSDEDFGNAGSCWWGSYSSSRCALKSNGGFGLRSFEGDYVSGRAWVLPLKLRAGGDRELTPTFETNSPDAFVVFNGYGDLNGYIPARILAHMAGMTYRKIGFEASPMYINAGGYLIAPEALATHYTEGRILLSLNEHANLFDTEQADRKELTDVA